MFFFIALILLVGVRFGECFFPSHHRTARMMLGALLAIAWIQIFGNILYYISVLNVVTFSIILISLPVLALFCKKTKGKDMHKSATLFEGTISSTLFTSIAFIIFIVLAFRMLGNTETLDSIRAPWEVLPEQFFLVFFLASVSVILLALSRARLTLVAMIPFFFLFFSVTLFVYPLGYGFDPFIHQATESYIAAHGTITPKPLTYIGQYALVDMIHAVTTVAIPMIDRLLLPILLALFLPVAGWVAFRKPLAALLLPMVPLAVFASTTPQAIANAFVLITLLLAIGTRNEPRQTLVPLWILGVATLLTHPLAGAPLLLFLFFWSMRYVPQKPRIILLWISGILGTLALPFLFIMYGLITGVGSGLRTDIIINIPHVLSELAPWLGTFTTKYNIMLDFAYAYGWNIPIILIVGSVITAVVLMRQKQTWAWYVLLAVLVTTLNGILLAAGIDFSFLPLYEQSGYATRLFDLALLMLVPLFLFGLVQGLACVIKNHGLIIRVGTVALFAGLLTASMYLTYPHHDAYTIERGWSVGAGDFEAVRFIDIDAGDEPFIVLANQAVSAAALKEFSFKRYFPFQTDDGPVTSFYYPIPTGGPLYEYFLKMSYDDPSSATIEEAMRRSGVRRGYFVVNKYWFKSKDIIDAAKKHTNDWWEFQNGAVTVFRFDRNL